MCFTTTTKKTKEKDKKADFTFLLSFSSLKFRSKFIFYMYIVYLSALITLISKIYFWSRKFLDFIHQRYQLYITIVYKIFRTFIHQEKVWEKYLGIKSYQCTLSLKYHYFAFYAFFIRASLMILL